MNWEWHELVDVQHFCTPISDHLLVHSLARVAFHEHLPCSSPMSCPYLTDIDSRVLLIISSVTDCQPQLLLAANTAQLHLLQENIQAFVVVLASTREHQAAEILMLLNLETQSYGWIFKGETIPWIKKEIPVQCRFKLYRHCSVRCAKLWEI